MATTLHSFMDIFDTRFEDGENSIQLQKIIIPIIQRDYAQGRDNPDVVRVRERFIEALYKAVTENPITLDFVYGDIDKEGNMTPLDGQQRLTTLFLLHWYAAKKENIVKDDYDFLEKFSYETRYSARNFCHELVNYNPEFKKDSLSEEIIDQAWFPLDWKNDPTISSMLRMLDAIHNRFKSVTDLWNKLKERCITFYFLPIKDMGLTDELYIKMNSRGKPLTLFEHFKAELEREIRNIDDELANKIMRKIDIDWTDLLWKYRNSNTGSLDDNIIDDEFLRYFKFICDVIYYRKEISAGNRGKDVFELLDLYSSSKSKDAEENIKTLERFFDCWLNIRDYSDPKDFLSSFMANTHEDGKILVKSGSDLNIFKDCLHTYPDRAKFPLNRFVLLYAITTYLQNLDKVTESDFKRRIRIVNNLIQNSRDEISDRQDRNRMPAILKQTEAIILTGTVKDISPNFNVHQILEEKEKIKYLESNPNMASVIFELEDHDLLKGQISIIGIENLNYHERFESLFECDKEKVDCAMMAIGNYGQMEGNKRRYQYGTKSNSSAWENLFHKSSNSGFQKTSDILISLLDKYEKFSNEILEKIAKDYLEKCEVEEKYPFRYYYIKYDEYRPDSYGKMWNDDADAEDETEAKGYTFRVMQTESRLSESSYAPALKAASDSHLSKKDYGDRLIFDNVYITYEKDSYLIRKNEDDSIVGSIEFKQNADGIDIEDRIIRLKNYIEENL
ncbi:MAG: DUF262 domain-containing protein [Haemophilus parainfluenzae]|jgi:raw score 3.15|nr:DUF262 domain-containing protein [Haemophilus parainfluenzae]